jgi:hypothetical protein
MPSIKGNQVPSKSTKQHNFMAAIAHSPSFAKKVGIPQSVGKDFNEADKGRKFSKGGDTMASKMNPGFMAMMAKKKDGAKGSMPAALAKHAAKPASKAHAGLKAGGMTKMGAVKTNSRPDGVAKKGLTKGKQVTMKKGGMC